MRRRASSIFGGWKVGPSSKRRDKDKGTERGGESSSDSGSGKKVDCRDGKDNGRDTVQMGGILAKSRRISSLSRRFGIRGG